MLNPNKENTTATFYQSYSSISSSNYFAPARKVLSDNSQILQDIAIEADTLLLKLTEKIAIDEGKLEKNYQELEELHKEVEILGQKDSGEKDVEQIVKSQKEVIRSYYHEDREKMTSTNRRGIVQIKELDQRVNFLQKEVEYERQEREDQWSHLIDSFEKQIVNREKQFKSMRNKEQEVFEETSLNIYQLEEMLMGSIDEEIKTRKGEHETVVRLVAECIESIKYIY